MSPPRKEIEGPETVSVMRGGSKATRLLLLLSSAQLSTAAAPTVSLAAPSSAAPLSAESKRIPGPRALSPGLQSMAGHRPAADYPLPETTRERTIRLTGIHAANVRGSDSSQPDSRLHVLLGDALVGQTSSRLHDASPRWPESICLGHPATKALCYEVRDGRSGVLLHEGCASPAEARAGGGADERVVALSGGASLFYSLADILTIDSGALASSKPPPPPSALPAGEDTGRHVAARRREQAVSAPPFPPPFPPAPDRDGPCPSFCTYYHCHDNGMYGAMLL